ncbi:unnamed protein product [Onchocerca flexuosa]|uniref:Very-long-chain (3R)-3-hydroxyacyl-CoA dehydratase n=1 Tax=Onchocerca flexuosa TaxID=387005 RepID=A0A183HQB8_9BILA|nr:unnamed protein product [Onchocerca flexuosa]
MQVYSRVTLVWLILYKVVSAQVSIGVLFLLMAWSITEVIRYSYYALALINAVSNLHTWLRQVLYSLFIVLYPLGVTGELLVILAALSEVSTKKHFTMELPNVFNIGFSFWWYLIAYIILYMPGLITYWILNSSSFNLVLRCKSATNHKYTNLAFFFSSHIFFMLLQRNKRGKV